MTKTIERTKDWGFDVGDVVIQKLAPKIWHHKKYIVLFFIENDYVVCRDWYSEERTFHCYELVKYKR